jgi:hypothetical protein
MGTNLGFTRDWLSALADRLKPIWLRRRNNTGGGALAGRATNARDKRGPVDDKLAAINNDAAMGNA